MKLFKWQGRKRYRKMCLYDFKILWWEFDGYILNYYAPTLLGWHRDVIPGHKHWRLNIKLWGDAVFKKDTGVKIVTSRCPITFFRPDVFPHMLKVNTATVKLSFGFKKTNI